MSRGNDVNGNDWEPTPRSRRCALRFNFKGIPTIVFLNGYLHADMNLHVSVFRALITDLSSQRLG